MKAIRITKHVFERWEKRFHFAIPKRELEGILEKQRPAIKQLPKHEHSKLHFNIGSIPVTVVVYKSHKQFNIITIYVNEKKPKGKEYIKKIKDKNRIKPTAIARMEDVF